MKKISFVFLIMALILCFSACGKTADPIALPSADKITSIEVAGGVEDTIITDKEAIVAIIEKVSEAQPTSQESVQDVPSVDEYTRIDMVSNGEISSIFVYQKDENWYVEQPYQGIYKTDEKTILLFTDNSSQEELFSNFEYNQIDKIQVIGSMGNPQYGADSKIITDENEIRQFIDTFNSGVIGTKVKDEEIKVGFVSRYTLYKDGRIVAEYGFNSNDTSVILWNGDYRYIIYDVKLKTPFELYQQARSPQIVVDKDGKEMDLARYNGETYVKSKLSPETIAWLEKYNAMPPEEQVTISFSPDLGEPFNP